MSVLFALTLVALVASVASLIRERCRIPLMGREINALRDHATRDGRLLHEAQRLLRDPRARGKNVRHSAWIVEVDEFTREWRGKP